jgi:RNA polymerase sigma-70 factor (ECF subfamily)
MMIQIGNRGLFSHNDNLELFDEVFKQYSKPLFYYAAKFVEDEAARDIVQDVFAKLWSDQNITIKLSLNSLLFTMVRNSCLQTLEKQKVRNKYLESTKLKLQEEELQFYMHEKTSLIEQELEDKLNEVLESLPERCKQIFMMSRFENKKNKEIAEELDISTKAVEKQITRALATIRSEMKDYLPLLLFLSSHLFKK